MGLCYLLTLYAFVRAVDETGEPGAAPRSGRAGWLAVSVAACLLGMGSKEVMVSAPLLVLLYDRTFVAGSFRAAWQPRARYYAALAGTWLLLGGLVLGTSSRGGTAGLDTDLSAWTYALTQLHAVALYLKLAVWPYPLVFDYGTDVVRLVADVVAPGLLVAGLAAGAGWALWRRPALGFLGAWFFAILAPTSSVLPVATQTMAEHRMYLPLAAVVLAVLLASHVWIGRTASFAALAIALLFGGLAWERNRTYNDELTLWADTVAKRPGNARAHYNLAETLARAARLPAAIEQYQDALRLDPNYAEAYNNLGVLLRQTGRAADARECFERSARVDPGNPVSRYNLGDALAREGRLDEAVVQFHAAVKLQPDHFAALNDLGGALLALGRDVDAIRAIEDALRLRPEFAEAHGNLGLALLRQNRLPEAEGHFAAVLRTAPRDATAHSNLGYLALRAGRTAEAVTHYRIVAQERPTEPESHFNLGVACLRAGLQSEATSAWETALRLRPGYPEASQQLARLRGAPLR
jgi:Flp pilus assembly protein TadD